MKATHSLVVVADTQNRWNNLRQLFLLMDYDIGEGVLLSDGVSRLAHAWVNRDFKDKFRGDVLPDLQEQGYTRQQIRTFLSNLTISVDRLDGERRVTKREHAEQVVASLGLTIPTGDT